ncbi:hypothetical protein MSG28_015981 [Choristoneura fumiferana]|uniref:Uncharacterized protein n=1 Tax=Choristoneura fumiferana TaxID=7141 RepID=A0ACC0K4V9_CHOFU|nr:hypothetical protein MSG28_015981 [Choristoneura fumiferana]
MALLKAILVICLLAVPLICSADTRVPACDQMCSHIPEDRNACCRDHGYAGYYTCIWNQMFCQ